MTESEMKNNMESKVLFIGKFDYIDELFSAINSRFDAAGKDDHAKNRISITKNSSEFFYLMHMI